jgi:hypothetical protein
MRRHLFVFALCILPFIPAQSATYYVDAKNGNDGNSGTSPSSAWKSLEKVNASSSSRAIRSFSNVAKRGESS